jgi:hypothetical protein
MTYLSGLGCNACGGTCSTCKTGVGEVDWEQGGDSLPAWTPSAAGFSLPDLSNIPTWGWIVGGIAAVYFLAGGEKRRRKRAIYRQYKARLDEADRAYSPSRQLKKAIRRRKRAA